MRRIHIFLFVLSLTLAVLLTLALMSWYFSVTASSYYGSSWMKQMWSGAGYSGNISSYAGMGGMMGNGGTTTTSTSFLWLIPALLGTVVGVAVVGVAFYYAYPELKYIRGNTTCNTSTSNIQSKTNTTSPARETRASAEVPNVSNNCDVILKTMTPEEKKVLGVIVAHQGKYLQKYVSKEAGLSRLKTHRIVARFAQRGIVTVKEFGNTNEIVVSDWVKS